MPVKAEGEEARFFDAFHTHIPRDTASKIGVAVSGGGDSMALLHLAARWASEASIHLEAVSVDHRLRPDAGRELDQVADLCQNLKLPNTRLCWQGWHGHGNLQAQARNARYRLMADWAKDRGIDRILLGHTRNDVAETFLMRLARRAGLEGLSAMQAQFTRDGIAWCRPFLDFAREDLRAYLRRHALQWSEDPSNDDPRFDRVKARQALPYLQVLGIDIDVLAGSARLLTQAKEALAHYARLEAEHAIIADRGDLIIKQSPEIPGEIRRFLWRAALAWIGGASYAPRATALEAVMISTQPQTLSGCFISPCPQGHRITREYHAVSQTTCATDQLWDHRWQVRGPHSDALHIGPLGEAVSELPNWRDAKLPRQSLMATPAIWHDTTLVAAPLVDPDAGWTAHIVTSFDRFLLDR